MVKLVDKHDRLGAMIGNGRLFASKPLNRPREQLPRAFGGNPVNAARLFVTIPIKDSAGNVLIPLSDRILHRFCLYL